MMNKNKRNQRRRRLRRRRRRGVYLFGYRLRMRRFIPFAALLLVFAVAAGMLINYGVHCMQRKRENAQISAGYEQAFISDAAQSAVPASPEAAPAVSAAPVQAGPTPVPTFRPYYHDFSGPIPQRAQTLYDQNNDLVGWLYIKGVVSLPVVQRDNEYYLKHNFHGRRQSGGTLFLDQYHPMGPETQHLLIHGHNMHDSSMFGIVSTYNNLSMVRNHGIASFSTMHDREDYVICAVLRTSPDINSASYFHYVGTPDFASEMDFIYFANELKQRSMFNIPIDLNPSDGLLSLATCIDDDRLLVVFRRIREGEDKDELRRMLSTASKK